MTDKLNENTELSNDAGAAEENINNVTQDESQIEEGQDSGSESSDKSEKMVPQSQVNKIVAREKREAEQRAIKAMEERLEQQRQLTLQQNATARDPNAKVNMSEMTQADLDRLIDERSELKANEKATRAELSRFAVEFQAKIDAAIESDPEFAATLEDLELTKFPNLAFVVNRMDNAADVLKDIAKNPYKFANVLSLLNSGSVKMAEKEIRRLSDSIKQNQQAKSQPKNPAPLSQTKPSNAITGGGKKSVSDLRLDYRV